MSVPNTNLTDGVIKLNEQLVSLLDNTPTTPVAKSYILKKGSLKAGVNSVESQDVNGAYRGAALALQATTGSMTLQYLLAANKPPQPLQFFSAVDEDGTTISLILEEVTRSWGVREESMIECAVRLAVGTKVATYPSLTQ